MLMYAEQVMITQSAHAFKPDLKPSRPRIQPPLEKCQEPGHTRCTMNPTLHKAPLLLVALLLIGSVGASNVVGFKRPLSAPQANNVNEWRFAVSGDSRNCGDITMPSIAQQVNGSQAQFYWHLGDFRAIYDFDQDMKERPSALGLTIIAYETNAWDDFIANQVSPFRVPVFLGIGNH